jgi:hypothetical protein
LINLSENVEERLVGTEREQEEDDEQPGGLI